MRVFSIYLSEDGLLNEAATNVKALFNTIESIGYEPIEIYYTDIDGKGVDAKYSYSSLLKAMNRDGFYGWAYIKCANDSTIEVKELKLNSK